MILYSRTAPRRLFNGREPPSVVIYYYGYIIPQTRRTFSKRPLPQRRGEDQSAFVGPHKNNNCETRSQR